MIFLAFSLLLWVPPQGMVERSSAFTSAATSLPPEAEYNLLYSFASKGNGLQLYLHDMGGDALGGNEEACTNSNGFCLSPTILQDWLP